MDTDERVGSQLADKAGLRPREIQARIRMGDTPEELAQQCSMPLDQIRKFAKPIIGECADIVTRVQNYKVTGPNGVETVGKLAKARLTARGISADTLAWAARRDIDAPWVVELRYDGDGTILRGRSARWTFDHKLSVLTALDDEARWLSQAEEPVMPHAPVVHSLNSHRDAKRAAESDAQEAQDETPEPAVSGAPRQVTGKTPQSGPRPARINRRANAARAANTDAEMGDIVAMNRWQAAKTETVAIPVIDIDNRQPKEQADTVPVGAAPAESAPRPAQPRSAAGRKNSRAAVPEWDEILFGAKR